MATEPEAAEIPLLTRAGLAAAGYDGRTIRSKRRAGELVVVRKGLYAEASGLVEAEPRSQHLLAVRSALQRVARPIVVSHQSASVVHGAAVLAPPRVVALTRERRCYAKFPGVCVYTATLPAHHVTEVTEMPVTTPARTVIDVARHEQLAGGLVTADAMLRSGACTDAELRTVLEDCARWPGIKVAAAVVEHADPRAETALESVSRGGMVLCGVPLPELQQWVTGDDGVAYRLDFLWRDQGLIGESDGRIKYADPEALWREKQRQEALERAGYRFVRWGWSEAIHPRTRLAPRLRQALART